MMTKPKFKPGDIVCRINDHGAIFQYRVVRPTWKASQKEWIYYMAAFHSGKRVSKKESNIRLVRAFQPEPLSWWEAISEP